MCARQAQPARAAPQVQSFLDKPEVPPHACPSLPTCHPPLTARPAHSRQLGSLPPRPTLTPAAATPLTPAQVASATGAVGSSFKKLGASLSSVMGRKGNGEHVPQVGRLQGVWDHRAHPPPLVRPVTPCHPTTAQFIQEEEGGYEPPAAAQQQAYQPPEPAAAGSLRNPGATAGAGRAGGWL